MPHRPIIFTDLDDTLFQTQRKFSDDAEFAKATVGALDRNMQPRSFISAKQQHMLQWLLQTTEVIPVTARGSEDLQRIAIAFSSYCITTHGAVILNSERQPDHRWQTHIQQQLQAYNERLQALENHVTTMLNNPSAYPRLPNVNAWCRMNYEYGQAIYLVMKVTNSAHLNELNAYADWVEETFDLAGFYVHRNDNNIAWLPNCIEKGKAVQFLMETLCKNFPDRPIIGIGDSLSDYHFMKHCDLMAIPKKSQFMTHIHSTLINKP